VTKSEARADYLGENRNNAHKLSEENAQMERNQDNRVSKLKNLTLVLKIK